jgi:fatty acid/phospholipid biosynthesis enzyme
MFLLLLPYLLTCGLATVLSAEEAVLLAEEKGSTEWGFAEIIDVRVIEVEVVVSDGFRHDVGS